MVQEDAIREADLVVNATPLGMNNDDPLPFDVDLLKKGQSVIDLVYQPKKTAAARSNGRSRRSYFVEYAAISELRFG